MTKTFFLNLAVGFWTHLLFSQEIVQSKIVDEKGEGIPFASVGIVEKNYGSVTFEDGSFSLILNPKYEHDSLIVSAIGYAQLKLAYKDFIQEKPETITLNEKIEYLNEITVIPEKLKFSKKGVLKSSSPNNYAINSPLEGASVAMLIEDISEAVLIEEIAVTVGKRNVDSIQIRCRVYEVDSKTGLPGRDLLKGNLIQTITEKQQRLVFTPSSDLWVNKPVYVAFEWVMTKSQFQTLKDAENFFDLSFIDEIVKSNSEANWNLNENKRILFRDDENNIIKRVQLTKEQTTILQRKDAAAPKLQFKIKMKGENTFSGSPISGRWFKIPHEALISVKIGKSVASEPKSEPEKAISFAGKEIPVSAIDDYLEKHMKIYDVPGLSAATFDQNGVIFYTTKGYANVASKKEVDPETTFEAASLSKPLFAYMVMKYVEQGLLDLDKPLHEYLLYDDIAHDERYKQITARMVLSHTTGFPNWRTDHAGELFISFDPGTKFQYSGEGYQYLAKVLASLLQTDLPGLEEKYQESIASPLGLGITKFVQDENNLNNKALGYKNGKVIQSSYEPEFGAAFSVHSEAKDFAKWLIALLNEQGLNNDNYAELFRDQIKLINEDSNLNASAWTLGFAKYELDNAVYYGHGGNNLGYSSGFFLDREDKVGAVVFTSADQVSEFIVDFFRFLIEYE